MGMKKHSNAKYLAPRGSKEGYRRSFHTLGSLAIALLLTCVGCGSNYNPAKPQFYGNKGSCTQALQVVVDALSRFTSIHKVFPDSLDALEQDEALPQEAKALVLYKGNRSLTPKSNPNTIVLVCRNTLNVNSRTNRYAATLDGRIIIISE